MSIPSQVLGSPYFYKVLQVLPRVLAINNLRLKISARMLKLKSWANYSIENLAVIVEGSPSSANPVFA